MFKKLLSGFFVVALLAMLFLPAPALAETNGTVYLPESETVNGLFFKTAKNITIDGAVNGEAYLIGQNIVVNGTINGDLIAVGANIDLNGTVTENARLIGGSVTIFGPVSKNLLVLAGQTSIEKKSRVGGNLVVATGDGKFFGDTGGETKIFAEKFFYDGTAQKDASILSSELTIDKEATFSGNLDYSTKIGVKNLSPQVRGKVSFIKEKGELVPFTLLNQNRQIVSRASAFSPYASFLSYLIFGLILAFLFPKNFTNIDRFLNEKPLASFICGVFFYCLAPFIFIILILTLIGIPMALLFSFIVVFLGFVSRVVIALFLGSRVLRDTESKFLPLLLGLAIIQVGLWIPFFGFILRVVIVFLGTGGLLLSKLGKYAK